MRTDCYLSMENEVSMSSSKLLLFPLQLESEAMHPLLLQVFWPMLVVATLAAVVASQALISAVFQIVAQVITTPSLNSCMPTGDVQHSFAHLLFYMCMNCLLSYTTTVSR